MLKLFSAFRKEKIWDFDGGIHPPEMKTQSNGTPLRQIPLATRYVMTLASVCAWWIDTWILIPLGLTYLRTLAFILVIAVVVQFTEMVVRKTSPALYRLLGIFLPLITTNCAVLGVALLNINLGHNFMQSALYGFSAAVGFSLVMVLFASIRERLAAADIPAPFRGNAIALVTAGLMSLAFMGFSGLVKL